MRQAITRNALSGSAMLDRVLRDRADFPMAGTGMASESESARRVERRIMGPPDRVGESGDRRAAMGRGWGLGCATGWLCLGAAVGLGCGNSGGSSQPLGLANPASVNCGTQGGNLRIETLGNGAQYGVCIFEDNRQCEEWALFRGDCPKGGRRVTGYETPGGRLCALRGGTYRMTDAATEGQPERGECGLPDGTACGAGALYAGDCPG